MSTKQVVLLPKPTPLKQEKQQKQLKQQTLQSLLSNDSAPTVVAESAPKRIIRKIRPVAKGQTTLATTAVAAETPTEDSVLVLTSEDPEVTAFYKSLTATEMRVHVLAKTSPLGLGTSYDVRGTHGFLKWKKARA